VARQRSQRQFGEFRSVFVGAFVLVECHGPSQELLVHFDLSAVFLEHDVAQELYVLVHEPSLSSILPILRAVSVRRSMKNRSFVQYVSTIALSLST
jgi:hypothetical protein